MYTYLLKLFFFPFLIVEMNNKRTANKRQRNASSESSEGSNDNTLEIIQEPPKKKKKRRSSGQASSTSVKKDKVYCICRTKYDPKKFYVGCDVCNNWFHGSCVGINEVCIFYVKPKFKC